VRRLAGAGHVELEIRLSQGLAVEAPGVQNHPGTPGRGTIRVTSTVPPWARQLAWTLTAGVYIQVSLSAMMPTQPRTFSSSRTPK